MTTFRNYSAREFQLEMPTGTISADWFYDNGLPMIVECACCGITMSSPSAWVDYDGYTYCSSCVGAEDD